MVAARDLPPQLLPVYGGAGGSAFTHDCGARHVLTGLRYRTGLVVDAVGILCRPVNADGIVRPGVDGGHHQRRHRRHHGDRLLPCRQGPRRGGPRLRLVRELHGACESSRQSASGIRGRAGAFVDAFVDAFGLVCDEP